MDTKNKVKRVDYFSVIDTKEKAYILGFIAGDGHIHKQNQNTEIVVAIKDVSVVEFIANQLNVPYKISTTLNKQKKIYPNATVTIYSKQVRQALIKYYGGRLKTERSLPRINKELVKYLVLGFFDAEGCITWGYRKDRNRLWQKISFTSQLDMLVCIQSILIDIGISTVVRPKGTEKCFVLEFANESDIYSFYGYLPKDLDVMVRKNKNYINWVRELIKKYVIAIGDEVALVDNRTLKKYNVVSPDFRFKGYVKVISVNGATVSMDNGITVNKNQLRKSGTSNYALRLKLDEFGENCG